MGKVIIHVVFTAKPGKESETRTTLGQLREKSLKDAGCLQYDMHESADRPDEFMLYECWESQERLDEHLDQPHLHEFHEQAKELFSKAPQLTVWSVMKGE